MFHIAQDLELDDVQTKRSELLQFAGTRRRLVTKVAREVKHACSGITACISIHVFCYKRITPLRTLLEELESSNYTGYAHPLLLVAHIDGPSTSDNWTNTIAIRELVEDFKWTHGPKIVDVQDENLGLKSSWTKAWPDPKANDVMIAFEDDIIPSRMYFQWLLKILTEYRLLEGNHRDPSLLGISLSPMRMDEISYPFRTWMTNKQIPHKYPVFLHAVPSSWGAAYFGQPWRDFLDFYEIRTAPPFYKPDDERYLNLTGYGWHTKRGDPNLWLPVSRSNNWVQSWKRYMVDFAYGRGAYMLYPNLANSTGLATSTFMEGAHVPNGYYKNPRQAPLANVDTLSLNDPLPLYSQLPLVDMHGDNITRRDLAHRGDSFVDKISRLGQDYATLANYWQRPCLLDVAINANSYTKIGVSTIHSPSNARYLVVNPQMGLNNQLIAIMYSAVWAHILGRILVLPYILWPRASNRRLNDEDWVPFHEIFDPTAITNHLPGLDWVYADTHFMKGWRPKRLGVVEPLPIFDKLQDTYLQKLGWTAIKEIDLIPYRPTLSTSDEIYQSLGSCDDEVLLLNGLYKNPQINAVSETQRQQLWTSLFRPTPMVNFIIETARKRIMETASSQHAAKDSLKYACLHLRMGDFSQVCSASPDIAPWIAHLYSIGRRCNASLSDIVKKANSLEMDNLVIISDDISKMDSRLSDLQAPNVWTTADIRSLVDDAVPPIRPQPSSELLDVIAAVVEQHICAQADHIMLNAFSTFSRSIAFGRQKSAIVEYW